MACGMQLSGRGYLLGYQEKACYLDRDQDDCSPDGARHWAARRRYLVCFYWSVPTISSVGYGDILPRSDNERIFSIFMMLIGGAFYGYVIGETAAIVTSFDANHAECFKKIDTVRRRRGKIRRGDAAVTPRRCRGDAAATAQRCHDQISECHETLPKHLSQSFQPLTFCCQTSFSNWFREQINS